MARVLVVDDDLTVRELLGQTLEDAGLRVDCAAGGRAALLAMCRATAEGEPYDAMVLDIIMPDVNGWRVLEALKSNPLWMDMPVVVVSGYANGSDDVARISRYDGFYVEKTGNFLEVITSALGRLVHAA